MLLIEGVLRHSPSPGAPRGYPGLGRGPWRVGSNYFDGGREMVRVIVPPALIRRTFVRQLLPGEKDFRGQPSYCRNSTRPARTHTLRAIGRVDCNRINSFLTRGEDFLCV